jgi:hypothetical protein
VTNRYGCRIGFGGVCQSIETCGEGVVFGGIWIRESTGEVY